MALWRHLASAACRSFKGSHLRARSYRMSSRYQGCVGSYANDLRFSLVESKGRGADTQLLALSAVVALGVRSAVLETEEIKSTNLSSAELPGLAGVADDALVELKSREGPSNEHTAKWRIYTDIARDLFSKGRLDEAEKYFVQALEEAKQGFGDEDPHVASSCNNLAELCRMKREYARAEGLFLEALNRLEKVYSKDHESVGFALHNLAGTYLVQRKLCEARDCYERSLKIKEKKLGSNHPEYANTLFHLGEVLRLQGQYKDAEELIRDSIRVLEEGGVGHSQTAIRRMGRLAEILVHTGQLQAAENLQRKVLHVLEVSQGPEATSTVMAIENLAGTLQGVGKMKEAEELLLRCFQVRQKILPPSHFQLGVTMFKLASVMIQHGDELASSDNGSRGALFKYETAEDLLHRSVRIAERCWTGSSNGRTPVSTQAGHLISLLRALDALGRLKIHELEFAATVEEREKWIKEAEGNFLQCLHHLEESSLPEEFTIIPEVKRQHILCLRHLAGLISSVSYLKENRVDEERLKRLLSRSASLEAELDANPLTR